MKSFLNSNEELADKDSGLPVKGQPFVVCKAYPAKIVFEVHHVFSSGPAEHYEYSGVLQQFLFSKFSDCNTFQVNDIVQEDVTLLLHNLYSDPDCFGTGAIPLK